MTISLQKISALTQFKAKELLKNKTFLTSFIIIPAFILLYRFALADLMSQTGESSANFLAMILRMGVLLTATMISLMMPATFLAKDKEKNTLRTLMTSSVSGMDYFISSISPVLLITLLLDILIVFFSGLSMSAINLPIYLIVSLLCAFSASILGMIIGIFSKNQMAASNNTVAAMMILMMIPMLSDLVKPFQKINDFLFTGIAAKMVTGFVLGEKNPLTIVNWIVLIGSCIALFLIFLFVYQQNGFEKD
ncbi:ABC transporter permease [Enterococcus sp. LJL99]